MVKSHMTTNIPIVHSDSTLADVQAYLWKMPAFDTANYIYVVGKKNEFLGFVSFKDLFKNSPGTEVKEIMRTHDIVTVAPRDHQEKATYLALRHGAHSIPVVDQGKLMGAIPGIELMKIMGEESKEEIADAQEDAAHQDTKSIDSVLELSLVSSIKKRAPWIIFGLFGGLAAAWIIHSFEEVLAENLVLGAFIPLVVYLGGAISAQIQMFYVRDLAVYDEIPLGKYLGRHFLAILAIGIVVSGILLGYNLFIKNIENTTAYVISFATLTATFSAIITGIFIPLILSKVLKDPANATPPVAIIASDVLSIILYFGVAKFFLL